VSLQSGEKRQTKKQTPQIRMKIQQVTLLNTPTPDPLGDKSTVKSSQQKEDKVKFSEKEMQTGDVGNE